MYMQTDLLQRRLDYYQLPHDYAKHEALAMSVYEVEELIENLQDQINAWQQARFNAPHNIKHAGRRGFNLSFMLQVLIYQAQLGISDYKMATALRANQEVRFLVHVKEGQALPKASTIAAYRYRLQNSPFADLILQQSVSMGLEQAKSTIAHSDQIAAEQVGKHAVIDASFVDAERRHDHKGIKQLIKQGFSKAEIYPNPAVARQKDVEATWAMKNQKPHFGYKKHVLVEAITKMVINAEVTTASVHDVNMMGPLVVTCSPTIGTLYGDSGYVGKSHAAELVEMQVTPKINARASVNHPLTTEQKKSNQHNSKVRSRVEHVFAHNSKRGKMRYIGSARVRLYVLLVAALHNMHRLSLIKSQLCMIKAIAS